MSGKPPRGYMPFLVGLRDDTAPDGWGRVATPFCDAADELTYPVYLDNGNEILIHTFTGDWYAARRRILRLFNKRAEAIHAAWLHSKRWWGGGEPLDVPAIEAFPELPEGYAIWIDVDQREVWMARPDGSRTGEFSGVSVMSGHQHYRAQAMKEALARVGA